MDICTLQHDRPPNCDVDPVTPPFYIHVTRAAYRETWDTMKLKGIFQGPMKTIFSSGGHCVRALQGRIFVDKNIFVCGYLLKGVSLTILYYILVE